MRFGRFSAEAAEARRPRRNFPVGWERIAAMKHTCRYASTSSAPPVEPNPLRGLRASAASALNRQCSISSVDAAAWLFARLSCVPQRLEPLLRA